MANQVREAFLANGLQVLLREVHSAPVTSTWLWYRVGSRNEVEGFTGISHWVEHMMFKGSPHFPKGSIMRLVDRYGGYVNAMTSNDFTTYYATLPSSQAELVLRIEADRMSGALFDPDEAEAERTVIIAEREGSENEPRFVLAEEMGATAFRVHPYHHQTIGWKEDLRAMTREDLYAHYRRYYVPNNAVLIAVGDFDSEEYLARVRELLEGVPSGPQLGQQVREEPPQIGEKRVVVRMPGSAPVVRISYHAPAVSHPDYVPLVLADGVLSGGKAIFAFGDSQARSARLYRALVETELATSAGSNYYPSLDPYLFSLGATVRDGREPGQVEDALLAEIRKLQESPVERDELAVAIRQTQAQFAYSSESVTSQALTLGFLEMVNNHARMDTILDEIARVTPEDVLRVAQTYLTENNRVVGHYLPEKEGAAAPTEGVGAPPVVHWRRPAEGLWAFSGRARDLPISPETVVRQKLDNGITVLIKENPASRTVTLMGDLLAGAIHDTPSTLGLANVTAAMVRRGTARHTYQEMNVVLDNVGASVGFSSGRDDTGFSARSLADDLPLLIDLTAECLREPTFPAVELEKLRGQYLTRLGMLHMDTGYRAEEAMLQGLYTPEHPYGRTVLGTRETLRALSADDVSGFHRSNYHPATLTLSVVGAIEAGKVLDKLAATLGQWRVDVPPHPWSLPPVPDREGIVTRRESVPGKSQADLNWGVIAMPRVSPDYYPAMMANFVLGRQGMMGRLGDTVRDKEGLAYYVSSSLSAGPGPYPWDISAGVNPKDVDATVRLILQEVARLRDEPISDEELDDCRSYLTGALPLHLETNEGIANFLLNIEEYSLGLDYLRRYPAIIGAVGKEAIQEVSRRYLTLDRYVLAVAGTFA